MEETSYRLVGIKAGLTGNTLDRYVMYMLERWKDNEQGNCRCGYAYEWAERFSGGYEYSCSDSIGQAVLRKIDKEFGKSA